MHLSTSRNNRLIRACDFALSVVVPLRPSASRRRCTSLCNSCLLPAHLGAQTVALLPKSVAFGLEFVATIDKPRGLRLDVRYDTLASHSRRSVTVL